MTIKYSSYKVHKERLVDSLPVVNSPSFDTCKEVTKNILKDKPYYIEKREVIYNEV